MKNSLIDSHYGKALERLLISSRPRIKFNISKKKFPFNPFFLVWSISRVWVFFFLRHNLLFSFARFHPFSVKTLPWSVQRNQQRVIIEDIERCKKEVWAERKSKIEKFWLRKSDLLPSFTLSWCGNLVKCKGNSLSDLKGEFKQITLALRFVVETCWSVNFWCFCKWKHFFENRVKGNLSAIKRQINWFRTRLEDQDSLA